MLYSIKTYKRPPSGGFLLCTIAVENNDKTIGGNHKRCNN